MKHARVSIVLPTRNGAATLPHVLDAIARQRVTFPVEVVAVDSASTDGTTDLLRSRIDQLISIPASSFDHGLTRNLGITNTTGEFLVMLVQDAIPASDGWLAALVAPLIADETLAGTFARQQPRPDASAIASEGLSRWVASSTVPRVVRLTESEFNRLSPRERLDRCAFDNVCSCIRRSVWAQHPFRSTPMAEDLEWAKEVLFAGYGIAYVPEAVVTHSHDRSARDEFDRTVLLHRRLRQLFDLRTIPTMGDLTRSIASTIVLHARLQRRGLRLHDVRGLRLHDVRGLRLQPEQREPGVRLQADHRLSHARALALAFAWPIGQYVGGRSAARASKESESPALSRATP